MFEKEYFSDIMNKKFDRQQYFTKKFEHKELVRIRSNAKKIKNRDKKKKKRKD